MYTVPTSTFTGCCGIPTCKEADERGPGSCCTPACPRIFPKLWQKSWWWRLWSRQASKRALVASKRCWKQRRAWTGEHEWKKLQRKTEIRQKEIERLEAATKEIPELWEERAATRIAVQRALLADGHKKTQNWLGRFSGSWGAGIRKPAGKELLLQDKRRPNGLCLGEKWPEKNFRQPSVMFSKGGGRLQPHDAVVATKKHQTAYLCARPPNLLEQKLFGTPLPYYPS